MPKILLEDEDNSQVNFSINTSYADNYDNWRRKEELQKYKDRYGKDALNRDEEGSSSSSSSSDEDTDVEANEDFDKEFYHTLSCLKAKDPKIYDNETKFFENADKKAENDEKKSNKKSKPMYLRDYERKLILEKGGVLSDEDEALDKDDEKEKQVHSPSYYEEQEAIKNSFKKALTDNDAEEENEGNSIGGIFSRKTKSSEEQTKEADEYAAWLQGRKDELKNEEEAKTLSYLRSYWTDPSLEEGEAFLRDYILQKKFTYKGKDRRPKKEKSPVESEEELEKEEEEIQKMEEFEHKYNFRFEEPDQDFIKRYPRTLDSTLRKQDDRRKDKRKDIKTRKELEIEKKKEELRKAKEFKRKEIEEKLKQLCSITGNPELGFKGEDLEEDFDPEAHDRRMSELFSQDDFYAEPEVEKPEFPEFDEELEIEDWDGWGETGEGNNANELNGQDPNLEDQNFIMDCDYDPHANAGKELKGRKAKRERGRRRRGVSSKLAEGLAKDKPVFDPMAYLSKNPEVKKSEAFEKYVDEYYGLDFEDVIGGDLPCRFKYRKVVPNDYGLTVAEILAADDKELNRWCSLKKALRIKPIENEKYDLQAYRKRASNIRLKQKIFPSLFANPQDKGENVTSKKKSKKMVDDKDKKQNKDNSSWKVSNVEVSSEQEEHESIETMVERDNAKSSVQEINAGAGKKKKKKMKSNMKSRDQEINGGAGKMVKRKTENNIESSDQDIDAGASKRKKTKTENDAETSVLENITASGNKKKRKSMDTNKGGMEANQETSAVQKKKFKKKFKEHQKNKGRKPSDPNDYLSNITKSRLIAYGINPKKFKNKLKYKKSQ